MNFNSFNLKSILCLLTLSIILISCESEDINPTLDVSLSNTELGEVGSSVNLTATLNSEALQNTTIPLLFSGTATKDVDYNISAAAITIQKGQTEGMITISGITDGQIEGSETIEISIENTSNLLILSNINLTITILDADIDSDNDGVPDASDECPNTTGDAANNGCPFVGFIINEVLYDPASGDAGDANGDGTRDANGDEFIEFFNSSAASLDISGYTISDASQLRHTFPNGTIVPSKKSIVVFGGGNPTGSFGGSTVQTASEGLLNISNAGDIVTLKDAQGNTILTLDVTPLDDNPNESYTRNPDFYGDFVLHSTITETSGALFSPGTKLDGTSF